VFAGGELGAEVVLEGGQAGGGPEGFDLFGEGFVGLSQRGEPGSIGRVGRSVEVLVVGVGAEEKVVAAAIGGGDDRGGFTGRPRDGRFGGGGTGVNHEFHMRIERLAEAQGQGGGGVRDALLEERQGDEGIRGQFAEGGEAVLEIRRGALGVGSLEVKIECLAKDGSGYVHEYRVQNSSIGV
jgi:hypothetical protein